MKELARAGPADLSVLYWDYISFLDASPRTVQTYAGNVRQFIKWTQAHGIEQPTRADIIAYRDDLRSRCKPATVQAYITALRLFFQWAAQAGLYPDIAQRVKGAKIDSTPKRDYLSAEQVRGILDGIDTKTAQGLRNYCLFALMVTGGLRDIEASRANVDDLQTLGGNPVLYLQGKGREERTEYIKIVPAVERALRQYLDIRTSAGYGDPLFISMSNNSRGRRLSPRSICAVVKSILVTAGYNSDRITAHSLRHTAVTLALLGEIPLEEVQQFARHRNIATTQIYAHNLERIRNRSEDAIAASIFL